MSFTDLLGVVGVSMVLLAYVGLQAGKLNAGAASFSALNAAGAALILVSLSVDFNLSAALIEGAWLLISLFGLIRALKAKE